MIESAVEEACDWIFVEMRLRKVRAKKGTGRSVRRWGRVQEDPPPSRVGLEEAGLKAGSPARVPAPHGDGWGEAGRSPKLTHGAGVGKISPPFFVIPNSNRLRAYQ
jgi:hypothetical protein